MTSPRTAFILEDHLLFAESFMTLLKNMRFFNVVLQSNREDDMWEMFRLSPVSHLFIADNISCIAAPTALKDILKVHPEVNIIIISNTANGFLAQRLLYCGAKAVISKMASIKEIAYCLDAIQSGRKYLSPDIRRLLHENIGLSHSLHLTDKEIQVLQFIAKGYTITKTAEVLNLSRHTIVTHRRNIMDKTGIHSATGLVKFGIETKLVEL